MRNFSHTLFRRPAVLFVLLMWLNCAVMAVRQQAVAVTGQLKCGDAPAANVRVKLFDEDSGPDPDDELDQGYTDSNGRFRLEGSTAELTNIDAVFKVYHDCDDGLTPGHRKIRLKIPNSYVTNGKTAKKTFNIGELNLETVFAEEQRELVVSRRRRQAQAYRDLGIRPIRYDNKEHGYDIFRYF